MAMAKNEVGEVRVGEVTREKVEVTVFGDSPLICNAMSAKASMELLLPKKKTTAERAMSLKHEPYAEFKRSMYTSRSEESDALVVVKATSFKKAIMNAALDLPGAKKAQIGRLMYVEGLYSPDEICIYGTPQMMMSITRSADMNKTPDVRTRAIFPAWCATFLVSFATPMLNQLTIANLLNAAGLTQGIGDWRVEKGSGNYGRFRLAEPGDPIVTLLKETGGRAAQAEAIRNPEYYDSETDELATWFDDEIERRGQSKLLTARRGVAA